MDKPPYRLQVFNKCVVVCGQLWVLHICIMYCSDVHVYVLLACLHMCVDTCITSFSGYVLVMCIVSFVRCVL